MNDNILLKVDGAPSLEELKAAGMLPSIDELKGRGCVCIECIEEIPCNPCETSCPQNAITVGNPITNLPMIDRTKCSLCGLCIPACPGLAITIKSMDGESARIRFPWEYYPLPGKGEIVDMVDRMGKVVCKGKVLAVSNSSSNNRTAVITAEFPSAFIQEVISIRRNYG